MWWEGKDYQSKDTEFLAGRECSGLRELPRTVRGDNCRSALAEYTCVPMQWKLVKNGLK